MLLYAAGIGFKKDDLPFVYGELVSSTLYYATDANHSTELGMTYIYP